jgi:hypothetical protein
MHRLTETVIKLRQKDVEKSLIHDDDDDDDDDDDGEHLMHVQKYL